MIFLFFYEPLNLLHSNNNFAFNNVSMFFNISAFYYRYDYKFRGKMKFDLKFKIPLFSNSRNKTLLVPSINVFT